MSGAREHQESKGKLESTLFLSRVRRSTIPIIGSWPLVCWLRGLRCSQCGRGSGRLRNRAVDQRAALRLPRTPRLRLDRIRIRSEPIKPSVAVLAPKWPYRYQRQHRQFEYSSTLRAMNVFAVAMRTCRHGTSPLSSTHPVTENYVQIVG
jgi:hypothetical protein